MIWDNELETIEGESDEETSDFRYGWPVDWYGKDTSGAGKEAFKRSNLDIPTSERQTLMGLGHSHYMNQIRKLVGDDVDHVSVHVKENPSKPNLVQEVLDARESKGL